MFNAWIIMHYHALSLDYEEFIHLCMVCDVPPGYGGVSRKRSRSRLCVQLCHVTGDVLFRVVIRGPRLLPFLPIWEDIMSSTELKNEEPGNCTPACSHHSFTSFRRWGVAPRMRVTREYPRIMFTCGSFLLWTNPLSHPTYL
jgi:hypothetical protein